ncbi:MAG: porin [Xenophilus sp.]
MNQKSLVALVALAAAGAASAQSSVTLFGTVDASVSSVSNTSRLASGGSAALPGSIRSSKTGLNNSAQSSSAVGFRGVEDLGGGLAASFWLETQVGNDEGTAGSGSTSTASSQFFNRRSTVSLSGNFGEIRLGRDYKPTFWNYTRFSSFGTWGAGTSLLQRAAIAGAFEKDNVRSSNSIGYFLPSDLGGFYGQAQYAFHEQAKYDSGLQGSLNDNSRGGRYLGARFGYANGPLDVAAAFARSTVTSSWTAGSDSVSSIFNLGASYDFGPVKLFGQYGNLKNRADYSAGYDAFNPATTMDGYALGVTAPVGAGQFRASYGHVKIKVDQNPLSSTYYTYQAPKADQWALGYVHNLSKRTALYATVAYIRNRNGAALSAGSTNITASYATSYAYGGSTYAYTPKTSIGYDIGIRHNF